MDGTNHIKRYIDFHNKYTDKYGENTVVLMQTGSHFNIFAVINDDINDGPDIYHICKNILNNALQVTKQNKNKPDISYSNCLLAGFPLYSIQKYENILLNNNYTVVIVEQITPPPNPERGVTRIISPGSTIEAFNQQENHYLMSIYIEKNIYKTKDIYIAGVSSIDLSTGKNYIHYIINKIDDTNYWNDEIGRYIHFYNPSELLFHFKNINLTKNEVIQIWDISHNSIQINHYKEKIFLDNTFQNNFLNNIFDLNTHLDPIEYFDLSVKPEVVISYIYLLNYIKDHRADTLNNIEQPEMINDNNTLCLTSNSIRQLNVINNYSYFKGKNESLLSVCNICVTPMGRRLFKERLLYPSINPDVINNRYDLITMFRIDNFYENVIINLKKVSDLEKSLRKMGINLLQPCELYSDSLSFEYIQRVLDTLNKEKRILEKMNIKYIIDNFNKFYNFIYKTFEFKNFSSSNNLERSILKSGQHTELDNYNQLTNENYLFLQYIAKRLSKLLDGSETNIKLDFDERNNWFLYCTNKRSNVLKERLKNITNNAIHIKNNKDEIIHSLYKDDFSFKKKDGSSTIIILDIVKKISSKLIDIQDKLIKLNNSLWKQITTEIYKEYNVGLKQFYIFLSEIDFYCAGAKVSIKNGYNRPKILDNDKSFLNIKDIRHPIVEKIHVSTEYIKNDIHLGLDNMNQNGILLFGTNACGKSTFMKAVGLNIIMAQAGLFVAASSLEFKPYTQIFTRILNNDNIFRSQSSFAVEIQELKGILNRADHKSLILGDELCSGTESISAISIITAGLSTLCKRLSSFIFTSHLHQLTEIEEVKSLNNLKIFHLKIEYDKIKDILIYDRKLEKGSGPSIYGLKVCEAMGLSKDFISFAKKIQNNLINEKAIPKKSQYNNSILMEKCIICSSKEQLETHHIKDQQYSDNNNMIDNHHKNIKHNLVPLCKVCHLRVTKKELIVNGWVETSKGDILDWRESKKNIKKKKFNCDEISIINKVNQEYPHISKSLLINKLELEYNIKISKVTLSKIISNNY